MQHGNGKNYYAALMGALDEARHLSASRRGFLAGSAKIAAGGAAALALAATPAGIGFRSVMAQTFDGPIDVLNYALTLEHLENTFYRQGNDSFSDSDFAAAGYSDLVRDYFIEIGVHEADHVDFLVAGISGAGGDPVAEAMYDFGYDDVGGYVAVAQVLENLGTGAYTGAAQFLIDSDDLLTAALTIHGVEARHASYLNVLNGDIPFPASFEAALTPADVLAAAGPLIVAGMPSTGTGSSL